MLWWSTPIKWACTLCQREVRGHGRRRKPKAFSLLGWRIKDKLLLRHHLHHQHHHVIYFHAIGIEARPVPPINDGHTTCEDARWHITNSSNHWSNLSTCKYSTHCLCFSQHWTLQDIYFFKKLEDVFKMVYHQTGYYPVTMLCWNI